MHLMKKIAGHLMFAMMMVTLPAVSFSQTLAEVGGKEAAVKTEPKAKEHGSDAREAKAKAVAESSASESAAAKKEKKAEESREEQDQDIMEQALILLQASQDYWVKGDVESALEMLDQAYALILDTNGEPDIARQKDDLRLLISKRILSIYSAMQGVTKGKKSEVPLVMNANVEREIRSFLGPERDFFISSYQRSFLYRPMIIRELKKAGLPEELAWLPLVESGFKISALSRARALGLWQFIPSTGYKYDLNRDDWIDERMDAEKSTRAAIAYLKELHGMFGDWLTVLAAYNCGEGRVMRVISAQHINYLDRFWDLFHQLPFETARYVPRFLATVHIIKNPEKYGMDLGNGSSKPQPIPYDVVKANKTMRLQDIASYLNVPEDQLNSLNSELRYKITPEKTYDLKVPAGAKAKFESGVDEIPRWEKPLPQPPLRSRTIVITHRVRTGETIAAIAKRYGTSVKAIRSCNPVYAKRGLKTGQRLSIPMSTSASRASALKKAAQEDAKQASSASAVVKYKVKKGDTLASISERYNIPVSEIKAANRLKKNSVKTGQVLRLSKNGDDSAKESPAQEKDKKASKKKQPAGKGTAASGKSGKHEKAAAKTYVVQKGDNLSRIAANNSIKVQRLRELNHIQGKALLKEGQVLFIE